jgi:hypothetical protein
MSELKYIRDDTSKAVLNTDRNALEQYKVERIRRENEQNTLQECVSNINVLKKDMTEIKNLLLKISEN